MGKLALMNPESLDERKKNPIVGRSAENHGTDKGPLPRCAVQAGAKEKSN
jgi:hypothetical protein